MGLREQLDIFLSRSVPYGFAGAVLVAVGGEVILNEGYGMADRERRIPNTKHTLFDSGSINKSFTAVAIMQLEARGLLSTSDRLTRFFEDVPEEKARISLHQLLTHTAGVVDFVGRDDFDPMGRDEVLARIMAAPLDFEPGNEYRYSNHGYTLLAMVIEQISGQSYRDYMRDNVFLPAGMVGAGWYGERRWREEDVAHGYATDEDRCSPYHWPPPGWVLLGTGGIVSTVEDLYKGHLALEGDTLLPEEAKRKMYTPALDDYAYGWAVSETGRGTTLIEHDGASMYGFSASFRRYVDEDVVLVLACNSDYHGQVMIRLFEDKLEEIIFGGRVSAPPALAAMPAQERAGYVGEYDLEGGRVRVWEQEGAPVVEPLDQQAINALVFPIEQHAALLECHERMEVLAENAGKGVFAPPPEMLLRPERASYYGQYIAEELAKASEEAGDLGEVIGCEQAGIVPMMGRTVGLLRLHRQRGEQMLRWVWAEGGLRGIIPIWNNDPVPLEFIGAPHADGIVVAYNMGTGTTVRLQLDRARHSAKLLREDQPGDDAATGMA
jgi:CubicO group peptidase (beta-lactamase class C family)